MKKQCLFIAVLGFLSSITLSGQSLYGSGVSPDSALLRVIYVGESGDVSEIKIGNETFSSVERELSRQYHPVSPGMYFFEAGSQWVEIIPASSRYYTIILNGEKCFVFEDVEHKAPAKSQIYFYNILPDEKANLHVRGGSPVLFENMAPGLSGQVAVNPLPIEFSVTTDKGRSLLLGTLPMERGGSTTVIIADLNSNLSPEIFPASVAKGQ